MAIPTPGAYVPLPGSERQPAPGAEVVGPVDPNEPVEVTIRLRSRASAGDLAAQAAALGAQPPDQRTSLTPEQYEALYGADPADVDKVVAFARAQGLSVVSTDLAARTVVVAGSAHAMEAAFRVELKHYTSPRGPYRGRVGPVQIPVELQGIVEGVFGLDNREQARRAPIDGASADGSPQRARNTDILKVALGVAIVLAVIIVALLLRLH
jgi:kumamolisin